MRKLLSISIVVASFLILFPVSLWLADPLFSRPIPSESEELPVLLVWPDHVQIRWFRHLSEISPLPKDAGYTFNIEPNRQAWVESAVRATPSPVPSKSSWVIRVTQIGAGRQKIDLHLLGDGIYGLTYEARPNEIVPLKWRLAGPGGSLIILAINALLCATFWGVWQVIRYRLRRARHPT